MIESVGLVLYRLCGVEFEVLIGHMGGPYFAKKNEGGWTFPKGLVEPGEGPLATAEREFTEELGAPAPLGDTLDLGTIKANGKAIRLFARAGDFEADSIDSNSFELEWPPRSGQTQRFPEIDRAAWVSPGDAARLLASNQRGFVDRLRAALS